MVSEKYKRAMDKIKASDELKRKIIEKAEIDKRPIFKLSYATSIAACFVALAAGVAVLQNSKPNITMPDDDVEIASRAESTTEAETAKLQIVGDEKTEITTDVPVKVIRENEMLTTVKEKARDAVAQSKEDNEINLNQDKSTEKKDEVLPKAKIQSEINEQIDEKTTEMAAEAKLFNEENVMAAMGVEEFENISELEKALGKEIEHPNYIPEGYKLKNIQMMFGSLAEMIYISNDDCIYYRTEDTAEDISGDYNEYEKTEFIDIGNIKIELKSNGDKYYLASWHDKNSFSLGSQKGISKEEMINIIKGIK